MERGKQIATTFFQGHGFTVAEIPVADERKGEQGKRADLAVFDGKDLYFAEVKEKLEADGKIEHSTVGFGDSMVNVRKEPHAGSNVLDGIFKRGAKQILETPGVDDAYRLIWLQSDGAHASMTISRALYTFYGIATLLPVPTGEGVNCVYFFNSTAFSRPDINGSMLIENRSPKLCLNEFSENFAGFQSSAFVQKMGGAIYDPTEFATTPGTIVLRSNISRSRESDVLAEVQRSTGIHYRRTQLDRYTYS